MKGWREYNMDGNVLLSLLSISLTFFFGIFGLLAFIDAKWMRRDFLKGIGWLISLQVTLLHSVKEGYQNLQISIKQLGLTETAHYRVLRGKDL